MMVPRMEGHTMIPMLVVLALGVAGGGRPVSAEESPAADRAQLVQAPDDRGWSATI